jgi:hypothetical protein
VNKVIGVPPGAQALPFAGFPPRLAGAFVFLRDAGLHEVAVARLAVEGQSR